MSKPRKLPRGFVTFVVQPTVDFRPTNWQQTPTRFRIVKDLGAKQFLGQADAWKFLFNQEVLKHRSAGSIDQWAIHLCLDDAEQLQWFQRQVEGFQTIDVSRNNPTRSDVSSIRPERQLSSCTLLEDRPRRGLLLQS